MQIQYFSASHLQSHLCRISLAKTTVNIVRFLLFLFLSLTLATIAVLSCMHHLIYQHISGAVDSLCFSCDLQDHIKHASKELTLALKDTIRHLTDLSDVSDLKDFFRYTNCNEFFWYINCVVCL